ncbi:MAG: type transport system permease protein [Thermoleophilaceae bacterium]|jgi:ABC-2 type transport system permease protein|nr:type transport system permease protein [Thermoleophilaceae bacterium]
MSGGGLASVSLALAGRHLKKLRKDPGLFMPTLVMPLFFFLAFAGGLSAVGDTKDFGYPDYTSFVFVFVMFQGVSYCGVFTAFALADDLESGFARRILLNTPRRVAIISGFALAALVQAIANAAALFAIGAVAGMQISGSVPQLLTMFAIALVLNVVVTLFAAGLALRLRSNQAGSLMLTPIFIALFLAPVYVPRELLTGWLKTAAGLNPLTPLIEACRGLLVGNPVSVGLAFACAAGLAAALSVWALTGLRSAERSGLK